MTPEQAYQLALQDAEDETLDNLELANTIMEELCERTPDRGVIPDGRS